MFGNWRETTLWEGAAGEGTVVRAQRFDRTIRGHGFSETFKLRRWIRVQFYDGSVGEARCDIPLHAVQRFAGDRTIDCWPSLAERTRVGAVVPVRYDEWDHRRIVLDLPDLIDEMLEDADSAPKR